MVGVLASLLVSLAWAARDGIVFCPSDTPHVYVGDVASDASCTHNDLQSAINAANPDCPLQIDITREHTYTQQSLTVSSRNVILQGWGDGVTCAALVACGHAACDHPDSTVPLVTIDGLNAAGRPLTITGDSSVYMRNLRIQRGEGGGSAGGGILYYGFGYLTLEKSDVLLSHAAYGGGIDVNGNGGIAQLQLYPYTQILNNTAGVSGGGIRLEGNAYLLATMPQTWIGFNHANGGYGGGVEVIGPARADIGSGGFNGTGVVSYNDAVDGGGISANAVGDNAPVVRLFTVDAANPVQVSDNTASSRGGGVYLDMDTTFGAQLCAFDFRIDDNQAPDGAAIFADSHHGTFDQTGTSVYLNTGSPDSASCGGASLPSLGAVDCAAGAPCNEIAGNVAADVNAVRTDGSVVTIAEYSNMSGDPVAFRANEAANVLRLVDGNPDGPDAILRNCLVVNNHTQHELISVRNGRDIGINGCTIARNTIDNGYSIYANVGGRGFTLVDSIIDQPGVSVLDYVGDNSLRSLSYLIANETSTLGGALYAVGDTPVYVDAANGDFHLAANSPGVDYAPAQGGTDLDGLPRTIDLPTRNNLFGPRDLGAYERQDGTVVDVLFQDSFE